MWDESFKPTVVSLLDNSAQVWYLELVNSFKAIVASCF